MEGFIGEVKLFAGTFAPRGWAFCEGQLLAISSYTALYSIIGDQFGGDGRTNFGMPDLRGRVPVGVGTGPGISPIYATQKGGYERVGLIEANLPAHNHLVKCGNENTERNHSDIPEGRYPAETPAKDTKIYGTKKDKHMAADMIGDVGGNESVYNMQPYLGLHYIICTEGDYPQRP